VSSTIIFTEDNFVSNYYESVVSNVIETSYDVESDFDKVKKLILSEKWDLVVIDYNHKHANLAVELVHQLKIAKPNIVTANNEKLWEAKKKHKSQTLCQYIPHDATIDTITNLVRKMIKTSARRNLDTSFCKVNINFFNTTKEIFCDVYLQLKDQKHVKLFNRYDNIDYDDLQKYKNKNVNYLYVKDKDFKYITKQLVKHLTTEDNSKNNRALATIESAQVNALFSMQLQETVAESIGSLGLSQDAVEITSAAINNTIDLVNSSPKVFETLKNSINGQNYISEHSFLTSFLACAVCNLSELEGEENTLSLTLASFFHDIALKDNEKAQMQKENEKDFKKLGIVEQDEIRDHPKRSVEIVSEIEGIPKDAITIIMQHHECYDGRGFPRGIDHKKISPLSTIFNLAHEICLYLYESGHDEEYLQEHLDDMKEKYPKGYYNRYLLLMERVLLPESKKAQEQFAS
jgi:HD-GYP domain-containing protein (c-di-GMP phosphodiesterase class II)